MSAPRGAAMRTLVRHGFGATVSGPSARDVGGAPAPRATRPITVKPKRIWSGGSGRWRPASPAGPPSTR